MAETGPTVRQRRVARELRRWRRDRDLTQDQVASQLGWSAMRVSRAERAGANMSDIIAMATVLRIEEAERDRVVALAQQAREASGWWTNYATEVVPHYVADLVETEADSKEARSVETMFVPGLLQTDAYMDALMSTGGSAATKDHIEHQRSIRLQRQQRLDDPDPLSLHAIVHETALRIVIGTRNVMAEQLEHIARRATQNNVTLQVIPASIGAYPGHGAAWQMFSYDGKTWTAAFIDHLRGGLYIEDDKLIVAYADTFDRLAKVALVPEESVRFVQEIRADLVT